MSIACKLHWAHKCQLSIENVGYMILISGQQWLKVVVHSKDFENGVVKLQRKL